MMEAPAWRALPWAARQVLDRLLIEHMKHGGTKNGRLICTYDEFAAYGIRRKSIATAIKQAQALGWIDVSRGVRSYGVHRRPSTYALTWLPREHDFTTTTNRWKSIKTTEEAMAILKNLSPKSPLARVAAKKRCDFSPGAKTAFSQGRKRPYEGGPSPKTQQIPRGENAPTSKYSGGGGGAAAAALAGLPWSVPVLTEITDPATIEAIHRADAQALA
jgi:hypothetical protein